MHGRPVLLAAVSSTRHDAFVVLVILHAGVAIAAFGAIAVSGVYGFTAQRPGRPGAIEELRRYFAKPLRTEAAVLAVAPLGVAALLVDPHGSGMGQLWVGAAVLLWVVASALWLATVRPAETAISRAVAAFDADSADSAGSPGSGSADAAGIVALGDHPRRLARAAVVTDIAFVLALALMVFQPA